eukprot:gene10991-14765_t
MIYNTLLPWISMVLTLLVMILKIKAIDDISVPLHIGESEMMLTFPCSLISAKEITVKFCNDNYADSDLNIEDCVDTIYKYLVDAMRNRKCLQVTLDIGGTSHDIRFLPEEKSTRSVAKSFCLENLEKFNLNKLNYYNYCVKPIKSNLDVAVKKHNKDKNLNNI